MEIKLIALTLFVLILIYLNYRRYRRLQQQRAMLQSVRNGLAFGQANACPGRRSVISLPRHQIAIIFPPSSNNPNLQQDSTINMHHNNDLPPSYQDLFRDQVKNSSPRLPPEPAPPYQQQQHQQLPSYGQIMNNGNGNGFLTRPAPAPAESQQQQQQTPNSHDNRERY